MRGGGVFFFFFPPVEKASRRRRSGGAVFDVSQSTLSQSAIGVALIHQIAPTATVVSLLSQSALEKPKKGEASTADRVASFDVGGCFPLCASEHWKNRFPSFSSRSNLQRTTPYLRARHVVSQAQAVAEELGDGKSRGVPGHRLAGRGNRVDVSKGKKKKAKYSASAFFFFKKTSFSTSSTALSLSFSLSLSLSTQQRRDRELIADVALQRALSETFLH